MRKLIVVPKTADALKALDSDTAKEEELLQLSFSEKEFGILWRAGFFQMLNEIAQANIDDYEDESIVDRAMLAKVVASEVFEEKTFSDTGTTELRKGIKGLFMEAIERETGVFFFF